MRVLAIGDIVGKPGREAVAQLLPALVDRERLDLVIANAENAAGGVGLTNDTARELLALPIDVLTSGNHIWKHKEIIPLLDKEPRLLRPLNYPDGTPGHGTLLCHTASGTPVGVVNVIGRTFMDAVDCPFAAARRAVEELRRQARVVVVELHAEATSEKRALGWYLDGQASAVYGTHTHVPTADEEVLPQGTAYLTDLGMTGPYASVIGVRQEEAVQRFLTMRPTSFGVARDDVRLCGAIFDIDEESGRARNVRRVCERLAPESAPAIR
jgi:2',3'-cyclic-nucleotide 2'-phosphodiesterase